MTAAVQLQEGLKLQITEKIIELGRDLAYAVALREIIVPHKSQDTKVDVQSENAIKELGKWLITVTGHPGRPVARRDQFIKALEMRLSGMSWLGVTEQICDCGKSQHDSSCKESIRSGANQLLSVLRKYDVGDVPPVDKHRSEKVKQGQREQKESALKKSEYLKH